MSRILDGKLVSHQIKSTVKEYIERKLSAAIVEKKLEK